MTVDQKIAARLAVLEADFLHDLVSQFENVAAGCNTLFFVTPEFNPHRLPGHLLPSSSAALSARAVEIVAVRNHLGLMVDGTPAALLLQYLKHNADIDNPHRLGPKRSAAELLAQLRPPPKPKT
jgi:hypothetical protein